MIKIHDARSLMREADVIHVRWVDGWGYERIIYCLRCRDLTTPHHTTPHHPTPHHTTPPHPTPHHTTPHHIISYLRELEMESKRPLLLRMELFQSM